MRPIVALIGYSNSGKTTVMADLIRYFKGRGYKVAAIKHAAHGYTADIAGTDSWLYAQAGADQVIIAGLDSLTQHEYFRQAKSLAEIAGQINEVDIILAEGFKQEPGLQIEIYRQNYSPERIHPGGHLLAVVSDEPLTGDLPRFSFNQTEELADYVIQQVMTNPQKKPLGPG